MSKKKFELNNRHFKCSKEILENLLEDMFPFYASFKDPILYEQKETHINFIKYLNDMIDYDNSNGIDFSDDGSIKWFDIEDEKKELILYTNLVSLGGRILLQAFDSSQNIKIDGGTSSAVETLKMVYYAIEELKNIVDEIKTKLDNAVIKPYGVNCVLVSLIEHELKLQTKERYIEKVLLNAKTLYDAGTLIFSSNDEEYFNDMYESLINKNLVHNGGCDIAMRGKKFLKFINDYNLNLNYRIETAMFEDTLTLNQLVQNTNATASWETEFIKIMKFIFGTRNLNLRNSLVHCGYTIYNYHSPYVSFLLFEILMDIVKRYYIK